MLLHSLQTFMARPDVVSVVCVLPRNYVADPPPWIFQCDIDRLMLAPGGRTRTESVRNGLEDLAGRSVDRARARRRASARRRRRRSIVSSTTRARGQCAIAALPVVDTLKEVEEDGQIVRTVERERLWRAQTPQGFPRDVIVRAHRDANAQRCRAATDDAALCERLGIPVMVVRGSERAMKITDESDFARAEALFRLANERSIALDSVLVAGRSRRPRFVRRSSRSRCGACSRIPTETVYGFGGGIDRDSVDALVALKRRPPGKPFLLLIAGPDMIERLDLQLPAYATNLVARHWPGPLTLVLSGGERRVPDRLRGPEGGVAVRWTSNREHQPPDSRARRRHHVDEREPAGGSACHVGQRDSGAVGRRRRARTRCACSTRAGSSNPSRRRCSIVRDVCRASFDRARSRRARCVESVPNLIGDA